LFLYISNYVNKFQSDSLEWFIPTLQTIINTTHTAPNAPSFKFELTQEAAEYNMNLLQRHNNDLQSYIIYNKGTYISFGSEFRSPELLEPLLLHHPNWRRFRDLLTQGSSWPLSDLSEEDRLAKNKEFIARGNHKSAITYESKLHKTILQEISQGWMFPLQLTYISTLKHGELAPVGIDDTQWSELPDGSKKTKFRMTHDQSFEASVGSSVNKRVQHDSLEPLYYGGCLFRLIHYIISIRARLSAVRILGGKSDF
jgi:hypothetical protein